MDESTSVPSVAGRLRPWMPGANSTTCVEYRLVISRKISLASVLLLNNHRLIFLQLNNNAFYRCRRMPAFLSYFELGNTDLHTLSKRMIFRRLNFYFSAVPSNGEYGSFGGFDL